MAALRFFYGRTLGRIDMVPRLPYPRPELRLPRVLSRSEVERLLGAVRNLKHRVILMTIYAAGLRTTEAVTLLPEDIDTGRMVIHVRQGKGRKDRIVPLSRVLLEVIRQYWRVCGMGRWLFPGSRADTPIGTHRVQDMTRLAAKQAGLPRGVTPRTLRHCFATHLLESGTDLRVIQQLLGHATMSATIVYTHLSVHHLTTIRSPLDSLDLRFAPRQLTLDGL